MSNGTPFKFGGIERVTPSPTNASKNARIARSTGNSLRASPALYASRWASSEGC
jgi:hypothetical protein